MHASQTLMRPSFTLEKEKPTVSVRIPELLIRPIGLSRVEHLMYDVLLILLRAAIQPVPPFVLVETEGPVCATGEEHDCQSDLSHFDWNTEPANFEWTNLQS